MNAITTKARSAPRKESIVNLRMPTTVRDLIDNAAELLGKSRSAFIIESSRKHAINVLLDQRLFALNGDQHAAFVKALDEKPAPNAKLKRLMASAAPWET